MVATRRSETSQHGTNPRSKIKEESPKLRSLAQGVIRHPTKSENAQSLPQKRNDNAVRSRLDAVIGDQSVASKGDHTTAPSIPPGTSRRYHGTQGPSVPVPHSGKEQIHASESWSHRFRQTRAGPNRSSMFDLETNLSRRLVGIADRSFAVKLLLLLVLVTHRNSGKSCDHPRCSVTAERSTFVGNRRRSLVPWTVGRARCLPRQPASPNVDP